MPTFVVLLRAVNVAGSKLVMAELRASLTAAGYEDVQTLLASGNVVLDTDETSTAKLESALEAHLADAHGLDTDVMVRTPDEWASLIAANPMPGPAASEPSKYTSMVMKGEPDRDALAAYLQRYDGPERIEVGERCLYVHYPDGLGRSRLSLPKKVGVGTVRNWNTVVKLAAILEKEPPG